MDSSKPKHFLLPYLLGTAVQALHSLMNGCDKQRCLYFCSQHMKRERPHWVSWEKKITAMSVCVRGGGVPNKDRRVLNVTWITQLPSFRKLSRTTSLLFLMFPGTHQYVWKLTVFSHILVRTKGAHQMRKPYIDSFVISSISIKTDQKKKTCLHDAWIVNQAFGADRGPAPFT